jgi:hypothetical protein
MWQLQQLMYWLVLAGSSPAVDLMPRTVGVLLVVREPRELPQPLLPLLLPAMCWGDPGLASWLM